MAHVTKLARLRVARVLGVVNRLGGPDSDVAIAAGGCQAFPIRGDVAAIDLEVLLLAAVAQPRGLYNVHTEDARRMGFAGGCNWITQRGG